MNLKRFFQIFLAAAIGVFLSYQPALAGRPSKTARQDKAQAATLLRVIDGDTIRIRMGREEETVRFVGIDTPEREANDKALRDSKRSKTDVKIIVSQGLSAKRHLESLIHEGSALRLEFDVEERDHYGRLLAYVYSSDGTMLNESMLRDGYAYTMTVPPNVKYADKFRNLFDDARRNKMGLWGTAK